MNMGSHPVKMQVADENGKKVEKVVGTANFPVYDSVAEAVEHKGEEDILALINAQTRTNELNRVRGMAKSGPSKKALEAKAIASFTPEDWQSFAEDPSRFQAVLQQRVDELRERELASVGQGNSEGSGDESE